jgi:hypothetical protein
MKAYKGVEEQLQAFSITTLDGNEWSASCPGCFNPGKNPMHLLDKGLGGPQSWSGRGDDQKTSFLPGIVPRSFNPYLSNYTN